MVRRGFALLSILCIAETGLAQGNREYKPPVTVQVYHLEHDSDGGARLKAAEQLGSKEWITKGSKDHLEEQSRLEEAVGALHAAAKSDEELRVRLAAIRSLASLQTEGGFAALNEMLVANPTEVKIEITLAAHLLKTGRIKIEEAADLARKKLNKGIGYRRERITEDLGPDWPVLISECIKLNHPTLFSPLGVIMLRGFAPKNIQFKIAKFLAQKKDPHALKWVQERIAEQEQNTHRTMFLEILSHYPVDQQKEILLDRIRKTLEPYTGPDFEKMPDGTSIAVRDYMVCLTRLQNSDKAFGVFIKILSERGHPDLLLQVAARFMMRTQREKGVAAIRQFAKERGMDKLAYLIQWMLQPAHTDEKDREGVKWLFSKLDDEEKFELLREIAKR